LRLKGRVGRALARARPGGYTSIVGEVTERKMGELITIAKALSDPNRARTLMLLDRGELCLCQIIAVLRLAPSTVSKHLSVLRQAELVTSRKEGRWIYYRLNARGASPVVRAALKWARASLAREEQTLRDARRLEAVKARPIGELCQCYKS